MILYHMRAIGNFIWSKDSNSNFLGKRETDKSDIFKFHSVFFLSYLCKLSLFNDQSVSSVGNTKIKYHESFNQINITGVPYCVEAVLPIVPNS